MKRYELIEQIALTKAAIMLKLDHLGIKSEIRTLPNGTKINSNPMMGTLIGIYSKEFYDHKTGDLKEKLGIENCSLIDVMSKKHLTYFLASLEEIQQYLKTVEYLYDKEDKDAIKIKMVVIAKQKREEFKKEKKNIPMTHLAKENSLTTLYKLMKQQINNFDEEKSEEEMISGIKEMSTYLQRTTPKKYNNEKAYGTIIGNMNSGFYSLKNHGILDYLKEKGIKVPEKNILNIMPKEQLKYRYVCLQFIGRYQERYEKQNFEKFMTRASEVGGLARQIYIEKYKTDPLHDLRSSSKIKNIKVGIKTNEQLSIKKNEETVLVEQLSMFEKMSETNKDQSKHM